VVVETEPLSIFVADDVYEPVADRSRLPVSASTH